MISEKINPQTLRILAEASLDTAQKSESVLNSNNNLQHELHVHQIELEIQNENLRQANEALEESREHYLDLYEFAPIGYLILSTNGLVISINLTGAKLLGKDRSQLLHQHFTRLIRSEDRDRWQLFFWNLMRFDLHKTIEVMLKREGNTLFHAQLDGVRILTHNSADTVRLALTDISERVQIKALKARCERYQLAETGSLDAIWDWDMESGQMHYSDQWYQMLGYWAGHIHHSFTTWKNLLHPDDRDETLQRLQQHLEQRVPFSVKYRLRASNGQYRWLLASGQALWNEQGQAVRMSGTVSDITHHIETEMTLIHDCECAELANHSKSVLLANMSHEIRILMSSIFGMTYLAQRPELMVDAQDCLNKVNRAAQSLLGLTNKILNFSKLEAGRLELEQHTFSLDELVQNLADMVAFEAQQKNIELEFFIDPKTPRLLIGDALWLNQILLNLVNNAIKFSDNSKVVVSINPEQLDSATATLRFSVQDSGIGINPAQIKFLFQPFSQADSTITRKYGGSGLGLAICKQLVELMGGANRCRE